MYVVLGYKDKLIEPTYADAEAPDFLQHLGDLVLGNESGNATSGPIPKLWPTATGVGERNILRVVELGDDRIALRSLHPWGAPEGQSSWVIAVHPAGNPGWLQLVAGEEPDERCTFHRIDLVDDGSEFALQTYDGMFVTAERDGRDWPLVVDRDVIGEWQRFGWVIPPAELVPPDPPQPTIYEQVTGPVSEAKFRNPLTPERPQRTSRIGEALGGDKPDRDDFFKPLGG